MRQQITVWLAIVLSLTFATGCNKAPPKASDRGAESSDARSEVQRLRSEVEVRDKEVTGLKAKLAVAQLAATKAQEPKSAPGDSPTSSHDKGGTVTLKDGKTRKFATLSGARFSQPMTGPLAGQVSFSRVPGELVFLTNNPKGEYPRELLIPVEAIKEIAFPETGNKLLVSSADGKSRTYDIRADLAAIYVHWESTLIEQILDPSGMRFVFDAR